VAPYLHNVDELPVIVEQESCEDLVMVLRVHTLDDSFEELPDCGVLTETVFPHVHNPMQMLHLLGSTTAAQLPAPFTKFFWVIESRRVIWAGHVERMRTVRNAYEILVANPDGNRPLGRHGCRW
jgi:hypothetical protein